MMRIAGRYELREVIGGGGMGRVWRAFDDVARREVAVKEMYERVGTERALREARAMARLQHPEIVRVHDVLMWGDRPWIVMEFLDGTPLDELIERNGRLPPHRVAEIGRAVLRALRHAHDQGIVHRDVKPGNVFVRTDGRVVLTDFGIASLDGQERLTATGYPIGTPGYIAPERLRHADLPPEPASDLFSLGALLYAALTGRAPFARDTPLASLTAPLTDRPSRPHGPPRLVGAVMGLLSADPRRRAGAAARLDSPLVAAPGPAPRRAVHALEAVLVAAALAGLAVGLGLAVKGGPDPVPLRPQVTPVLTDPARILPSYDPLVSPPPLPIPTPTLDLCDLNLEPGWC
ncbi:serine/threonine-protein kinase [Actinocorallia populi]|uniref:serine/threonine-protein kinase n=1 Tax=Actinocorallia populi TaxID=2079200 RepID=UPI000D08F124|nr:serine/threonine-protein kinase [Actinocorallia populi]